MSKVIVYVDDTGQLHECYPILNCGLTVEQIAEKDVPTGLPYKILDEADIPVDLMEFRDAWTIDLSAPDGTGADYGTGSDRLVDGYHEDGTPIIRGEEPPKAEVTE